LWSFALESPFVANALVSDHGETRCTVCLFVAARNLLTPVI
jgi:hypothetical protein